MRRGIWWEGVGWGRLYGWDIGHYVLNHHFRVFHPSLRV